MKKPSSNIIIYPMLTAGSLSTPTVLTVSKAMERLVLIYNVDSILITGRRYGVSYYMKGKRLHLKEWGAKDQHGSWAQTYPSSKKSSTLKYPPTVVSPVPYVTPTSRSTTRPTTRPVSLTVPKKKSTHLGKTGKIEDLDTNISAEPTMMNVYISRDESRLLGVKIVPIRVQSEGLVELLLSDTATSKIKSFFVTKGRIVQRKMWNFYSRFPFNKKGKVLTTDPKKDIILAKTKYKEIACLLNYNDIENQLFRKTGGISKLQKMGWGAIIVADEVQRIAYFCMKQFNGYCTAVNFALIQSSLRQTDAFDSLEDVRKSSSGMFRVKKRYSALGERFASYKLNTYKRLLEN